MNTITKQLFDELQKRGLTITEFAKITGIPRTRVYSWEHRANPKARDEYKILQFLQNADTISDPGVAYGNQKLTALDASVAVLMQRVSKLLANMNHTSEIVELRQIEKDAQALRQMQQE